MDYWRETLVELFGEHDIEATPEQIEALAKDLEIARECWSESQPPVANPLLAECDDLRRQLKAEREKVACQPCKGTGRIILHGPYHSSDSQCWKCNGEGKHAP